MIADILTYKDGLWVGFDQLRDKPEAYQLLLLFGEKELLNQSDTIPLISEIFTNGQIVSTSTAGEICQQQVQNNSIICIAIRLDHTAFTVIQDNIKQYDNAVELGASLVSRLEQEQLKYLMILSDGNLVNGDELVAGINSKLHPGVQVSGAMAGDGIRFKDTLTGSPQDLGSGNVVLIAFYGNRLRVSIAYGGGWSVFGPERIITNSNGNELFEIDGENALETYKRYIGDYALSLPASALLFPIALLSESGEVQVVRTILNIKEENGSLVFAGNVPQGTRIKLMRSNTERIIQKAGQAAYNVSRKYKENSQLALLFNCIGRKLVLDTRVGEEIAYIASHFTKETTIAGMYSYGEFTRNSFSGPTCELHNQTVVITVFDEL